MIHFTKYKRDNKVGKPVHTSFHSDLTAMFMMRMAIPYRPWIMTEIKWTRGALRLWLTTSTLCITLRKKGEYHNRLQKTSPFLDVTDIRVEHLIAVQSLFMFMYVYVTC